MNRLATVLIIDSHPARAEALRARLTHGGYHANCATGAEDGQASAQADRPDLVVIGDVGGEGQSIALALRLKEDGATADIPVVLIADTITETLAEHCLNAGLDDCLGFGCDDAELFARMRPLVRLATMHAELRQRAAIARAFGVDAAEQAVWPAAAEPEILVVGDNPGPVEAVLGGNGQIVRSATLFEAEDLLTRRNFDAAVLSFAQDPEGMLNFCAQVRNNPRLFNLPMVLLAGLGTDAADAYRRGATRVLVRPVTPAILKAAVLTLVRRQQLRWSIRGAMGDSLQPPTRDSATGTYSRAFVEAYLTARIGIAQAQDRHLTVVFFAAPNIDGVRQQFGDDAALHLTQQVGQWITGLLRAEDLVAAFKPNEFCVVLPDTPMHEAEVVMHRIAGVLAYTDFAVRDVYQPVKVWVQVGRTGVGATDTLETVIARARQSLD